MTQSPQPIRLAFVGGGGAAMIGPMHRRAASLDGRFRIVAGVLSSDPEKAKAEGIKIGLPSDRAYPSLDAMLSAESRREDGMQAVSVVTPNESHHRFAAASLDAGLDVFCDKPMTNSLDQAKDLAERVKRSGLVFCLTHNYSGYPMVREARARVTSGELGAIRAVHVEYLGAGLAARVEDNPNVPKRWRFDTKVSGPSLVLGDIGTHAHQLASFVLGEHPDAVSGEVLTLMPGRNVHDYATVRMRFPSGACGLMTVTQAAAGFENHIQIRVFGEKGSLEWKHSANNHLTWWPLDGAPQTLARGMPFLSEYARRILRLDRTGHPEGFCEAFANLYAEAGDAIAARRAGKPFDPDAVLFPTVRDGVAGMSFVEAALRSSKKDGAWEAC